MNTEIRQNLLEDLKKVTEDFIDETLQEEEVKKPAVQKTFTYNEVLVFHKERGKMIKNYIKILEDLDNLVKSSPDLSDEFVSEFHRLQWRRLV